MSQSLEHIDDYFQGTLNPAEASDFEKAISSDPEFAKEVAFYLGSVGSVKDALNSQKKARFRQIYDASRMVVADQLVPSRSPGASIRKMWKYAAAAAVFSAVLVSIYFYTAQTSPKELAEQYITTKFSDLGASMGTAVDSMEAGKRLNNDGDFAGALAMFEGVLAVDPTNVKALEYAGITALELNDYGKALKYFTDLSAVQDLMSNPGNFYTAVTLMKRDQPGDKQKAKELLQLEVKTNSANSETAADWLKKW